MAKPCSVTQRIVALSDIFLSSTNISRCACDHMLLPLMLLVFLRISRRFHFVKRNRRQSRCPPQAARRHDSCPSHGQPFEKQYFIISRLPIAAATLIVLSSHSQCFTSLAHLRNSSLFVEQLPCKTRLDLSHFHFYFSLPKLCYSTPIPTSKWMNIR